MSPLFNRRRRPASAAQTLLPLLWGNAPMDTWPPSDAATAGVNGQFVVARGAFRDGRVSDAVQLWQQIADERDTEARNVLQAWTFLRANGVTPPASVEKHVLGVVVEVPVSDGRDVLAAYRDGSSRYLNYSGSAVVGDDGLQSEVAGVIEAGQQLAQVLGTWDKPELPPLPAAHARLTLLTPAGFRFGQGPDNVLLKDPNAAPVFAAAAKLLSRIVQLSRS